MATDIHELSNRQVLFITPYGRIGLLALATHFNSEQALRRMYPEGAKVFTNRVLNTNPVTIENLRNTAGDVSRAAGGILPVMVPYRRLQVEQSKLNRIQNY